MDQEEKIWGFKKECVEKFLRTSREMDGYDPEKYLDTDLEAWLYLHDEIGDDLDLRSLKELHGMVSDREDSGMLRKKPKQDGNINNWATREIIKQKLDILFPHINKSFKGLADPLVVKSDEDTKVEILRQDQGVIQVALYHHYRLLYDVFPFENHNGVVARLIFLWQLLRWGSSQVYVFDPKQKEEYFKMFLPFSWRHNDGVDESGDRFYGFQYYKYLSPCA